MSAKRTERLLNLVICLLASSRWITKEEIRRIVSGYDECESDEAFDRMFERDKDELRGLGIPIDTGSHDVFDDTPGYRVDPRHYGVTEIHFTPEEIAVVGIAGRLWHEAALGSAAASGLQKLRALAPTSATVPDIISGGLETPEPAFAPLLKAIRERRVVKFSYSTPDGRTAQRTLEPWALTSHSGRWYVAGRDQDRDARRTFRLSRISGTPRTLGSPQAYDIPDPLDHSSLWNFGHGEEATTVTVALRAERAQSLRSQMSAIRSVQRNGQHWDLGEIHTQTPQRLLDQILGFGADAVLVGPAQMRDEAIRRLTGAQRG